MDSKLYHKNSQTMMTATSSPMALDSKGIFSKNRRRPAPCTPKKIWWFGTPVLVVVWALYRIRSVSYMIPLISNHDQFRMIGVINNNPRVVFLDVDPWGRDNHNSSALQCCDETISQSTSGKNSKIEPPFKPSMSSPMQAWQTGLYPTCNSIHEIDLQNQKNGSQNTYEEGVASYRDDSLYILGSGFFRHAWKLKYGASSETAVIKTLRMRKDIDYTHRIYEIHRREAVAMDRLTKSPYIVDIFGACGPTVINEFAVSAEGFLDVMDFANKTSNMERVDGVDAALLKLNVAVKVTLGLQHIHEIDGMNNATMVYNDMKPSNVAITSGYIPKLNDFNGVQFLQWDNANNQRVTFGSTNCSGPYACVFDRSPEEMRANSLLDEKIDVYSLGNVLFTILTNREPWKGGGRKITVLKKVRNGDLPEIPLEYKNSTKPAVKALVSAIRHCYVTDPKERMSARGIASGLLSAISEIEKNEVKNSKI